MKGRSQVTVSYALTSLPATAAGAERLLKVSRGHWGMENRVHWCGTSPLTKTALK